MHQRDFPFDQTTNKHIFRFCDGFEYHEYLLALRMSPPASFNGLAGNYLGQTRYRTPGGYQHHAALFDKLQCLSSRHPIDYVLSWSAFCPWHIHKTSKDRGG